MADVRKYSVSFNAAAYAGYTQEQFVEELKANGTLSMYEESMRVEMFKEIWKDISKIIEPPKEKVSNKQSEKGAS